MEKTCIICGISKELSEFYKHPAMSDGHVNKCKTCCKAQSITRYQIKMGDPDFVQKERSRCFAKNRKRRTSKKPILPRAPKHQGEAWRRHFAKFPEKYHAAQLAQSVKVLFPGNHKHHWSYREEHARDIIELTPADHKKAHYHIYYDQEHFAFRTVEGDLLNSKNKHIDFIMSLGCIIYNKQPILK